MNLKKIASAFGATVLVAAMAASVQADGTSRTFDNPQVGSKRLDGCYSWPGPCRSQRQANTFCRGMEFHSAVNHRTSNAFGIYQTRRLGDGGVCTASCTVMVSVECAMLGGE